MRKRYGDVNWGLYENPGHKTWIFFKKQEVRPFSKRDWLGQDGPGDLGRGKVKKGELLLMGKRVTVRHTCASLQREGGWTAVSIKKQKRLSDDISLLLIGAGGVNRNPQSLPAEPSSLNHSGRVGSNCYLNQKTKKTAWKGEKSSHVLCFQLLLEMTELSPTSSPWAETGFFPEAPFQSICCGISLGKATAHWKEEKSRLQCLLRTYHAAGTQVNSWTCKATWKENTVTILQKKEKRKIQGKPDKLLKITQLEKNDKTRIL